MSPYKPHRAVPGTTRTAAPAANSFRSQWS